MRIVIGLILFFGLCSATVGAERFPYVASIAAPEVGVRSGPGVEFYETSVLRRSDKVEVYHEAGDWLAVRPPLGSFSWVSGRYVDINLGNIGTVTVNGLAARIGSENGELCETVQVKLKKGEKLLVLDRKETPENVASPFWYKISPPSGEYRWIPRSAITSSTAQIVPRRQTSAIVPVRYEMETKTPVTPPPLRTPLPPSANRANSVVKRTPITDDLGTPGEIPPLAELLANADPSRKQGSPPPLIVPEEELTPFQKMFQKAFEELKQETRIALIRPTDDWVFETLIRQGNDLYEVAQTDDDLEKLYHLVETLQRTRTVRQEIAMRRQSRSGSILSASQSPYGSHRAATPQTPPLVTTAANRIEPPDYDIVGRLGEFDPRPVGYPPYAVVNDKGEIVCLITPAAGVDLGRYLGKHVGVNGVLGRYETRNEPDKRHITAMSVAEIIR